MSAAVGIIEQLTEAASKTCSHVIAAAWSAVERTRYKPEEREAISRRIREAFDGKAPLRDVARVLLSNKRTKKHLREVAPYILDPSTCPSCAAFARDYFQSRSG